MCCHSARHMPLFRHKKYECWSIVCYPQHFHLGNSSTAHTCFLCSPGNLCTHMPAFLEFLGWSLYVLLASGSVNVVHFVCLVIVSCVPSVLPILVLTPRGPFYFLSV